MNLKINVDKVRRFGKKMMLYGSISGIVMVSGCSSNDKMNKDKEFSYKYEKDTHKLLEVDRNLVLFGKEGKYGLGAPDGYNISDYDYDRWGLFEYNDYVYVNNTDVYVTDSNKFGAPGDSSINNSDVYEPSSHVIVDINKNFNMLLGKNDTSFALEASSGYDIVDYDYDKTEFAEYENVTYVNNNDVVVDDVNDFGIPVNSDDISKYNDSNYEVGEHKLVVISRNINFLFGKNQMKEITAPDGYKVIDYDYDKTETVEFETITYENIVPVYVSDKNTFGVPISKFDLKKEDNIYRKGQHVLVDIDRNLELVFGENGTRELVAPDGYDVIDYDYDKNKYYEFETYVYVNNKDVYVDNIDNFGTVVNENKVLKKQK